ncbi:SDR family NAD(P)-dependent oxidoreductase [Fibrella sp. HMF5335]|uniref:SDR family NAD(P)-dependent oxidoreductase n=1 Tax=Fibrella rubiginis TaxID=2817060 RepID=A0A939GMD7_9BACT|nr:SDR family NAD(P)-dependent oxidoreductase [Fibrella rubiginis]MBO0939063.1 SDR family NAD(P)-dependent oxidoreductase [Fibrella rubiginis]
MKTALITGANSGIGLATAKALAAQGFGLILLCRSAKKGEAAVADIRANTPGASVDLVVAALDDAASVRAAAAAVLARHTALDVLINNAGYSPDQIEFTKEGVERSFYANHLGHFILTRELAPLLLGTPDARVINVSSSALNLGKASRFFQTDRKLGTLAAYGDGKLANVLFTMGLAAGRLGKPVIAYAVHPGVVNSNFGSNFTGISKVLVTLFRPLMRSVEKGAATSVFLATSPTRQIDGGRNGGFFADSKPKKLTHKDLTDANVKALWEKSSAY